ncbi:hypothetical protein [Roseomonas mucosa]|uniref:hypothetical protein n=1 Tax=Roseomonas mucosa TaxID=207340 RepID=UPI002245E0AE|nr:hypothetical protein [Roseomonas mucosa]UZO91725.1 Hypothetical protein RMP42_06022 [Roseomonas mucosa]
MKRLLLATVLAAGTSGAGHAQTTVYGGSQYTTSQMAAGSYAAGVGIDLNAVGAYGHTDGAVRSFNENGASQVHGYGNSYGYAAGPNTAFSAGQDFAGQAWQYGFGTPVVPGVAQ